MVMLSGKNQEDDYKTVMIIDDSLYNSCNFGSTSPFIKYKFSRYTNYEWYSIMKYFLKTTPTNNYYWL